jgi:F0F1-type ATP synthase assembly protein I
MKRKILQFEGKILAEREVEVKPKNSREEKERFYKTLSLSLNLGGSIVLPIAGGALLGSYLDSIFASSPIVTLTLLLIGVIFVFYRILRLTQDIS